MNPDTITQVTRLDNDINNLVLNGTVDATKIRELQERRIRIDQKFREFRERMDRENKSFDTTIRAEIEAIFKRLQEVTRPQ